MQSYKNYRADKSVSSQNLNVGLLFGQKMEILDANSTSGDGVYNQMLHHVGFGKVFCLKEIEILRKQLRFTANPSTTKVKQQHRILLVCQFHDDCQFGYFFSKIAQNQYRLIKASPMCMRVDSEGLLCLMYKDIVSRQDDIRRSLRPLQGQVSPSRLINLLYGSQEGFYGVFHNKKNYQAKKFRILLKKKFDNLVNKVKREMKEEGNRRIAMCYVGVGILKVQEGGQEMEEMNEMGMRIQKEMEMDEMHNIKKEEDQEGSR